MAEAGANEAIFYRARHNEAKFVLEKIVSLGRKGLAVQVDVTNYEQLETEMKKVRDHFGRIDILVNNAGRSPRPCRGIHPEERQFLI